MSQKNLQLNLDHLRPWLTLLAVIWLLGSLGLGWLVNSLLIIFGLLLLAPVIGVIWFRWWLQSKLVANNCPVCGYKLTVLDNSQLPCVNCGEQLIIQNGQFQRFAPDGTIDVTAVEVSPKSLED
jgi:predicted RNA-binding Zn-ribbon protein involved in translation (DUF1610 family)